MSTVKKTTGSPPSPVKSGPGLPLLDLITEVKQRTETLAELRNQPKPPPAEGALQLSEVVSGLVAKSLDFASAADMDRHDIAAKMSRLTGNEYTKGRLDKLAAPSQEGYDIKAWELPALMLATGCPDLLAYLAGQAGYHLVDDAEYTLVELGRVAHAKGTLDEQQSRLLLLVSQMSERTQGRAAS